DVQQGGGPTRRQVRAQVPAVGGAPSRDEGVDQPERGIGAGEPARVAVRVVHPLARLLVPLGEGGHDYGAGAPTAVISAVSTVRPGPKAIAHTRASRSGVAVRRMCWSTNITVVLDMLPKSRKVSRAGTS